MTKPWQIAIRAMAASVLAVWLVSGAGNAYAVNLDKANAAFEAQEYDAAMAAYMPAAKAGNAQAQYAVGMMYRFGWGVEKDFTVARQWFERGAEQGHAESQSELGKIHKDGRGVTRDAAVAAKWFEKAALQGLGVAQLNLARMYRSGKGVAKSSVMAHAWFSLAIDAEYMDAIGHRARLSRKMSDDEIAQAKAKAKELRGRIQGS